MHFKINLLSFSFISMVFFLVLVPASGLLELKALCILFFLLIFISKINIKYEVYGLAIFISVVIYVLISSLNTLLNWTYKEDILIFLPTILLISTLSFLGQNKALLIHSKIYLKYLYYFSFILALIKLSVILLPLSGVVSGSVFVDYFTVNFPGVSSQLFWGDDRFVRISMLNELILSFSFLLGLIFIRKKFFVGKIYLISQLILVVACILSFQRLIWIYIVFISIVYVFFYSKKQILYFLIFISVFLAYNHFNTGSPKGLIDILYVKLNDSSSLDTKSSQVFKLLDFYADAPVFGHGLTTYIPEYIRSNYKPYIYEFQFGTLLVQLGIIGTSLYLLLFFIKPFLSFTRVKFNKDTLLISFSFSFLFLSSFVNPYLLSISAIPFFLLHYFMLWENKYGG
jgi:hypothetical protein